MLDKYECKCTSNEDIDKLALKDQKLNSLQLDFRGGSVDQQKFIDLFNNKLCQTKGLEKLELDLSNFDINNQQIEAMNNFFKNTDLKELHLHLAETKLFDDQFDRLLNDSLAGKKSINKLHLNMENVNITSSKRASIDKLVKSLPNLNYVHINLQRNNLSKNELTDLHNTIFHFPHRVLLW